MVTEPTNKPSSVTKKRPRVLLKLLLLGCSVLFFCGVTEIVFRLFVSVTNVAFQFWDPAVGIRRKPNQRGVNIAGSSIHAPYNFNAQGWNYPRDFSFPREPGTLRICLTGDSYVEAMQVPCDKQMAVIAEQTLTSPGSRAEVYPFGCSGYGTAQEYQLIRHYIVDYKPDAVILFFTQNDVYDSSPYIGEIESSIPAFALDAAGGLEPMGASYWERSGARRMMAQLALSRYFLIQKRLLDRMAGPRGPGGVVRREMTGSSSNRFRGVGLSETQRYKKSWELIAKLLEASKNECASAGIPLCVAFRGHLREIKAAERGETYTPAKKELDPYCMLDERIDEMGRDYVGPICQRLGIPFLDLTTDLVAMVKTTKGMHNFPDDDHYNVAAHEVAGKAMAGWIRELISRGVVKQRGA